MSEIAGHVTENKSANNNNQIKYKQHSCIRLYKFLSLMSGKLTNKSFLKPSTLNGALLVTGPYHGAYLKIINFMPFESSKCA